MKKKYRNTEIAKKISEETGIHISVVHIVIYSYFRSFRKLLQKHNDMTVTGFFKFKLKKSYRKRIDKRGNRIKFQRKNM